MSEVTQSCPTLCDPMDHSLPGSSAHGIFQASVLEWVAISLTNSHVQKASLLTYTSLNVYTYQHLHHPINCHTAVKALNLNLTNC